MRKGFTIIELLVASLLLGMLVTILTMIFNQSSIAWRTGSAGVAQLSKARNKIAVVAEQSDNAFICNNNTRRILGLWDDDKGGTGDLRTRACDVDYGNRQVMSELRFNDNTKQTSFAPVQNIKGDESSGNAKTYIVNVMSAGPDKTWETYDDIWSFPEWQ